MFHHTCAEEASTRASISTSSVRYSGHSRSRFFSKSKFYTSRFAFVALALLSFEKRGVSVSAFTVVRQNNSCDINRIVFGTAAISKAENPQELLDEDYRKRFRRFDLARTYGAGASEKIFGEWMSSRQVDRSSVDIITKGGMGSDAFGRPDRPLLTHSELMEEVSVSLQALQTDFVNLYMFHRDDPRIPAETFVLWANELVDAGKIGRWGVSNWSFERFRAAHSFAIENGFEPPSSNSPQFSLAVPQCEVWPTTHSISAPEEISKIRWYEENNVELLCWEVLAKGFMAKPDLWPQHEVDPSSFDDPVHLGSEEWRIQRLQKAYCNPENYRRREVAMELAKSCGCNLAQIAVLYPLTVGKHISVIFGTKNAKNLEDMVSLQHLHLDEEALMRLAGTVPIKSVQMAGANNVRTFRHTKIGIQESSSFTKKNAPVLDRLRLFAFRTDNK